jgi:hypothetical protein
VRNLRAPDVVYKVGKLSEAARKRPFYEIGFSPVRLEIACEIPRISAGRKTYDMSVLMVFQ